MPRILVYRYPLPARRAASADGRQLASVDAVAACLAQLCAGHRVVRMRPNPSPSPNPNPNPNPNPGPSRSPNPSPSPSPFLPCLPTGLPPALPSRHRTLHPPPPATARHAHPIVHPHNKVHSTTRLLLDYYSASRTDAQQTRNRPLTCRDSVGTVRESASGLPEIFTGQCPVTGWLHVVIRRCAMSLCA